MNLAQKSMEGDLKKLDPEAEHNWLLCSKVPWEGYSKKNFKNKKESFEAKALHVECKTFKGEDLLELLWRWQNSGMATTRFG